MNLDERIELLQQQMLCVGPIYTFRYDTEGNLKCSNCPDEAVVDQAFGALGGRERMLTYSKGKTAPLWISSSIGLEWMAVPEYTDSQHRGFCVLGPCLNTEVSHWAVEQAIQKFESANGRQTWTRPLLPIVKNTPVLMQTILMQDMKLLYCCVTGKSISASDIIFCTPSEKVDFYPKAERKNRFQTWMTEQALLKVVRDGDLILFLN